MKFNFILITALILSFAILSCDDIEDLFAKKNNSAIQSTSNPDNSDKRIKSISLSGAYGGSATFYFEYKEDRLIRITLGTNVTTEYLYLNDNEVHVTSPQNGVLEKLIIKNNQVAESLRTLPSGSYTQVKYNYDNLGLLLSTEIISEYKYQLNGNNITDTVRMFENYEYENNKLVKILQSYPGYTDRDSNYKFNYSENKLVGIIGKQGKYLRDSTIFISDNTNVLNVEKFIRNFFTVNELRKFNYQLVFNEDGYIIKQISIVDGETYINSVSFEPGKSNLNLVYLGSQERFKYKLLANALKVKGEYFELPLF